MGANASKHGIAAEQDKGTYGEANGKNGGKVDSKGMKSLSDEAIDNSGSSGLECLKKSPSAPLKSTSSLMDSPLQENRLADRYVKNEQNSSTVSRQGLMCVWQTLYAIDPSSEGSASKHLVLQVTRTFTNNSGVRFSVKDFDGFFKGNTVDFDQYSHYIHTKVSQSDDVYKDVEDAIEAICWEMCKNIYSSHNYRVTESAVHKLWQLFSRLCEPGTMPPTIDQEEANWIGEKLSASLHQRWDSSHIQCNMSYDKLMEVLTEKCLCVCSQADASQAIEDLHAWLVQGVAMTGWLTMRTRNQANWTSWSRRWVMLVPHRLFYYDNDKMDGKRGEFTFTFSSKIQKLPEMRNHHKAFRFKVINSPYLELELDAADDINCSAWMSALMEGMDAAKSGPIPMHIILKDRQAQKKSVKFISRDEPNAPSKSGSSQAKQKIIQQKLPSGMRIHGNKLQEQLNRIQEIFRKVDLNHNGSINGNEFRTFIKDMGLSITDDEIINIFSNIETSGDGKITIDEFTNYFMNNVLDETGKSTSDTEASLQSAFLKADRDGSGTVDFHEIAEHLWEKRRSMRMSQVMSAFDNISGEKEEISFDQFKDLFATLETSHSDDKNSVNGQLQNMFNDVDAEEITSFLRERWDVFSNFKRSNSSGETVMTGGDEMVADVLPGEHNLVDLAFFSDLPPIEPLHTVIKNVSWVKALPGGHGKAIFPADFDGKIPIEIATTEHLRYYGACLAESTQVQVSLLYRHGIQDFTYENKYLSDYVQAEGGGCGIEIHDFSHLDCPMAKDSGHFVMGKMEGEELHLTAFKVPTRHTLYIPGGVIHSNDYLRGTWRTMLSDEAAIDHVHIVKRNKESGNLIKFAFDLEH